MISSGGICPGSELLGTDEREFCGSHMLSVGERLRRYFFSKTRREER